jgi:hypothetical protein
MWKDPIVKEVRKVRKQLEKEAGNDLKGFIKNIYAQQQKTTLKLVSRGPKRKLSRKAA